MEKLFLLTFVAIQLSLTAQEIIPIPVDTTSVWRIGRAHNDESCVYHYNSIYYIDGTVMKWGKEYYKVYEEGEYWETPVHPENSCNGEYDYTGVFRGAIRTENGKTYGYTSQGGSPGLLMDFTLNVGDTLYSDISDGFIVNSIDSVLVGDEYRKRLNMSSYWYGNVWMVEGVGHQRGLFESMNPFEGDSQLGCYGENGVPIFGNLNCDITVGQVENSPLINDIKVYPNPTSGKITINTSELNKEIKSYILTDIYGKIVLNKNVGLLNNNDLKINIENYESGVYLLIINLNNKTNFYGKIIKN